MIKNLIIILSLIFVACSSASVNSYVKKADKLVEQEKVDEAIIIYQKAIQEHPDESVLYLNQAALFRKMQKYPNAIRNYEVILRLNPDSFWPYIGLGRVYLLQKNNDGAQTILTEGLKKLPDNGPILFYLGRTYYQLGDGDQALEYLNKALDAKYPKMHNIYYYRGLTFENLLKNKARANLDYKNYLMIDEAKNKEEVKLLLEMTEDNRYDF